MRKKKIKRALTLLEIMIVIVLIGIIGSVIGVNMKGSLDKGRAFKTRQAKNQIQDILMLEIARGMPATEVQTKAKQVLEASGLIKNPDKFLKDGWGKDFVIKIDEKDSDKIIVVSSSLEKYDQAKKEKLGQTQQGTDDVED